MESRNRQMVFLGLGLAVLLVSGVIMMFFMTSARTETTEIGQVTTTSDDDSGFPIAVFIPIIAGALIPIYAVKQRQRDTAGKPKHKPKRKRKFARSSDGEYLEVVDEDDG